MSAVVATDEAANEKFFQTFGKIAAQVAKQIGVEESAPAESPLAGTVFQGPKGNL
jgi:hypothetical protein